ncbi:sigma-54-dependent transcriptional regulator [Synoicihabitans lomoniglobus]|uniref:DNA-binding transcriptional regulator NtrC n=1 Tax=Synoicihabitans lomoniglobus TaxID=2909285 RepID=A0AAF0CRQ2_9BACT|nr:sigma-54 dependent transcriptional regulator [Opitutaceae bacterium LMO-M01]WED66813.1 sigma-54 dependent transcriptional regulator [Opitutaceae bacterium LMO-M01]
MTAANSKSSTILIIDDDDEIRYSLGRVLSSGDYQINEAASGEEGVAAVKKGPFPDLIFLDIRMGGMSGIETLQHIRSTNPKQLVVLMTAFGTAQTAIEAMKFGAFDYIMKPFDPAKVLSLAETALQANREMKAVGDYKPTINSEDYKEGIVGSSAPMQEVFKIIGQVTASDVTVMITGESGTGKELVARSIWKHSHRSSKPFIAVNCAAIPDNLIESELFGHEKGSFTGATGQRIGKFELCDGGTIFLDEIGDMALATQTKILRVLQQGEIQRVGGTETIKVDVRIIAATNKNLEEMVPAKEFREDLYYRLNVVRIKMPPLRERADDIPQIIDFCLQNLVKSRKTRVSKVSPEAIDVLTRYRWHGNVRELENVIYRSAVIAQGDAILPKDLPSEIRSAVGTISPFEASPAMDSAAPILAGSEPATETGGGAPATMSVAGALDYLHTALAADEEPILSRLEREMVTRVLAALDGNQAKAAERLGMTRTTLRKRIDAFGLKDDPVS